jgi:hypothetical protein
MNLHVRRWSVLLLTAAGAGIAVSAPPAVAAETPAAQGRIDVQQRFTTPESATAALVAAVRAHDPVRIRAVLGPGSDRVIRSGDPVADREGRARFVAAFEKNSRIEMEGDAKATLVVGPNDWPLPFPLIKHADGWTFDAKSGAEEVLNRRIGRNELAAIQVCLAYVDAQREYASTQGNRDGMHEYAMKLVSSAGKKDGLYWRTKEGWPLSPLGPLAEKAKEEGYGKSRNAAQQPYHGYIYRILTGQGSDAPGGAYDYVVHGRMVGGFALVAYPARWGASGVMTLIVNHDGTVYEKNLGKATEAIASKMTRFNPDSSWSKTQP